ncbi:MAG: hypothetical protein DRP01_00340 [Archaeoglobales archaeon]|nr:MAG: hypothetical protein DRP01_00340 [Archaeoglobales archaeon]
MSTLPSRSYLGIDPSPRSTGLAILIQGSLYTETIKTQCKGADRLFEIHDRVHTLLTEKGAELSGACIEGAAYNANTRADDMGQVRGVLLLALLQFKLPFLVIPPAQLKKYGAAHGAATKNKMIAAAKKEWGILLPDDEADAAWLAHLAQGFFDTPPVKRHQLEVIHGIRETVHKDRAHFTYTKGM